MRTLVTSSFYGSNGFPVLVKFFGIKSIELPSVGQALALMNEYIMFGLFEKSVNGNGSEFPKQRFV